MNKILTLSSTNEVLGIPIPIWSIVISVSIFVLGIIINASIAARTRRIARRINRDIAKSNQEHLIVELKNMIQSFKNVKEQMVPTHGDGYIYHYEPISSISVFKEIGYHNLYNAYLTGWMPAKKRETKAIALNNLWRSLENIVATFEMSVAKYNDTTSNIISSIHKSYSYIGNVNSLIEDFRIKHVNSKNDTNGLGDFYKQRENDYLEYLQDNPKLPFERISKYHQKIVNLNALYMLTLNHYNSDIKFTEINSNIQQTTMIYKNIQALISVCNLAFGLFIDDYEKILKTLNKSYQELTSKDIE